MSAYALAVGAAGKKHHEVIACLWDQFTKPRISDLFRPPYELRGARVLDIGAGCGSVTLWLAAQVGREGHVYALDLDPSIIPAHPRLTTITADLNHDPLPDGPFDFIHARQVLPHVRAREAVLRALVERLAPGGWLLVEDLYRPGEGMVIDAPSAELGDLVHRTQTAIGQIFAEAGSDREWSSRVPALLRALGLGQVRVTMHGESWASGREAGPVFLAGVIDQLRPRLLAHGLSEDELSMVQAALLDEAGAGHDPAGVGHGRSGLLLRGHTLWCTAGQAAGGGDR